jgi:hypothetical protein
VGGNELPNSASGSQLSDRSALSLWPLEARNAAFPMAFELRWKFLIPARVVPIGWRMAVVPEDGLSVAAVALGLWPPKLKGHRVWKTASSFFFFQLVCSRPRKESSIPRSASPVASHQLSKFVEGLSSSRFRTIFVWGATSSLLFARFLKNARRENRKRFVVGWPYIQDTMMI